jgi:hypothetical protein
MRGTVRVAVRIRPSIDGDADQSITVKPGLTKHQLRIDSECAHGSASGHQLASEPPPDLSVSTTADTSMNSSFTSSSSVCSVSKRDTGKVFDFEHIFHNMTQEWRCDDGRLIPPSSEDDVFTAVAQPIVNSVLSGQHGCIIAYGQTGSGKTHTMFGADGRRGLIPRVCETVTIASGAPNSVTTDVRIGFVEVYNDQVFDLLRTTCEAGLLSPREANRCSVKSRREGRQVLCVREDPRLGVFLEGQTLRSVTNRDQVDAVLRSANLERSVASTKMNTCSSRSHAIVHLVVGHHSRVMVSLVDLAGSERVKSTEATGVLLEQAKHINKSLATLGRVVDALGRWTGTATRRVSQVTPPFRESKLTHLLKPCLEGTTRAALIATISPTFTHLEATLGTLRFASKAREVVTTNNFVDVSSRIAALRREICRLQSSIRNDETPRCMMTLHSESVCCEHRNEALELRETMLHLALDGVAVPASVLFPDHANLLPYEATEWLNEFH